MAGDKAKAISLDVTDTAALENTVKDFDLVISLIPYIYHADVAKACIKHKVHVVTTSYTSPALKALEPAAKEAGVIIFNEIGLDPGLDHLYAVKTIDEVHKKGGKIVSFLSYCGGLPAPEDSDNPLGYKFSWSSRGVLLALRNSASFWAKGEVVNVQSKDLMAAAKPYFIYPGYAFVCYPNRDSTTYKELYGIPEAKDVVRGTLRYQGFPEFIKVLVDIGFLSEDKSEIFSKPVSWKEATASVLGSSSTEEKDLIWAISSKTEFKDTQDKERIISGLKWIGLFSDEKIIPRGNPLDTLCATLEEKMQFGPGERDMVMLQHKFGIEWADGTTETRTSTLVENGVPGGYSAMAKLVGVPCAVAVKQVLNGTISEPGVHAPLTPKYAYPLLEQLKNEYGIYLTEKTL